MRKKRLNRLELKELLEGTECLEKGRIKVYKGENYCYYLKKDQLSPEDLKYMGKAGLEIMIGADEEKEIREKMEPLEKKPALIIVGKEYEEIPRTEIPEAYLLRLLDQVRRKKA